MMPARKGGEVATASKRHSANTMIKNSAASNNGNKHTTARELMKRRGELDISTKTLKETPIRISFSINDDVTVFPTRKQVIGMLATFMRLENTLPVKLGMTGESWKALKDLFTGAAFTEAFAV